MEKEGGKREGKAEGKSRIHSNICLFHLMLLIQPEKYLTTIQPGPSKNSLSAASVGLRTAAVSLFFHVLSSCFRLFLLSRPLCYAASSLQLHREKRSQQGGATLNSLLLPFLFAGFLPCQWREHTQCLGNCPSLTIL